MRNGCNPILISIVSVTIVIMTIDDYVPDVLMRDLVGHDHAPAAFLVYVHLWRQTLGRRVRSAHLSHQMMADATGLSKSAVQNGMRCLLRRRLVRVQRASMTAIPEYRILRPWVRG